MADNEKMRVGVLCGGFSGEREVSLRSGANVLRHLSSNLYDASLIDITSETDWQIVEGVDAGKALDLKTPGAREYLQSFGVFVNVLHGAFGEDGGLQAVLDQLGVPYTGSGAEASRLAIDKVRSMERAKEAGILVPAYFVATKDDQVDSVMKRITEQFGYPAIVKPNDAGSTLGLSLVQKEDELAQALAKAAAVSGQIIVQQYISGREFTGGVLGNTSTHEGLLPLPLIEIIIKNKIFDFNDKYFSKETQEICPAPIDRDLTEKLQQLCLKAHTLFGCDGLSRSDFKVNGMGEAYFLELNSSPGMSESSLCPKEIKAQGMTMPQFLDRLIDLALSRGMVQ